MDMQPVQSSGAISGIGYDSESQTLEVHFAHGGKYRYSGVSESDYQNLMAAPSKGQHLRQNIVGRFKHQKV